MATAGSSQAVLTTDPSYGRREKTIALHPDVAKARAYIKEPYADMVPFNPSKKHQQVFKNLSADKAAELEEYKREPTSTFLGFTCPNYPKFKLLSIP